MPIACLKIDSTIMIRVNEVIPSTTDGNRVIAVINARICSDNEYEVEPSAISLETRAGNPDVKPLIIAGRDSSEKAGVATPMLNAKRTNTNKAGQMKLFQKILTLNMFTSPALKFFNKGCLFSW